MTIHSVSTVNVVFTCQWPAKTQHKGEMMCIFSVVNLFVPVITHEAPLVLVPVISTSFREKHFVEIDSLLNAG